MPGRALFLGPCHCCGLKVISLLVHQLRALLSPVQSEQTMAEQEARLQQAQEQLQELHALEAQLQRRWKPAPLRAWPTIAVLKATMESASTEALELEQRRHLSGSNPLQMT